jgi:CHAT domain-containing protein
MATTYLFYGRFNEALTLFDQVLAVYLADQRAYDAVLIQLYVTDCLLQLGRFEDVLTRCAQIRPVFDQLGVKLDIGKTMLNEGIAYAGLRQFEPAIDSLQEAHDHFEAEGNYVWVAMSDVERAAIYYRQGAFQACFDLAGACQAIFQANQLQLQAAQAQLTAAMAASMLNQADLAEKFMAAAQNISQAEDVPWLRYQLHRLRGLLAWQQQQPQQAVTEYEQAIHQLERMRGQIMIEFRVDFLADKERLYEEMVRLQLELGNPDQALAYVERAKSRALTELLAYQLDLQLRPRSKADEALISQLLHLRNQRNQLIRGWTTTLDQEDKQTSTEIQQTVQQLEQTITTLWHQLLIRNADYARDAALTHVRSEPIQPHLTKGTVLLEYFALEDGLILFLVTQAEVQVHRLPGQLNQITTPARLLNLSFKAVPNSAPAQLPRLQANTKLQLQRLYTHLLAPVAESLQAFERLIIVPHGPLLHYLPFHALHTGQHYLIEQFEISYLPSASLLHYIATPKATATTPQTMTAFGYSYGDQLPYALHEAAQVAEILGGQAFLETAATLDQLQQVSAATDVLHLATHGDFNPQNPLFSSLALADGSLSTLDIFNLRLQASLVTLSACQTGRSLVKGGDELMGLMRAFLYAGAASLVLSQWRVADEATLHFMEIFYQKLAQGHPKGQALQATQGEFLRHSQAHYAHPYYWAAFFLVGDTGEL